MAKLDLVAPFVVAVIFTARLATYDATYEPGRVIDGDVEANASNIRSFDDVVEIRGGLVIQNTALTKINRRDFPRLKNVTNFIEISSNEELVSLTNAFPSLEFANVVWMEFNNQLKSITASFPRARVNHSVYISDNALLTTITSSFTRAEPMIYELLLYSNPNLTTVANSFNAYNGSVCWYDNGVALNSSGLDLELASLTDCNFAR